MAESQVALVREYLRTGSLETAWPRHPLSSSPASSRMPRVFAAQVGELSALAPCSVADLTRHDTIAGMASAALREAPAGKLCIAGHSMGGYVALEMLRQAPGRIERAAFLCTNARPDAAESTENRKRLMAARREGFPFRDSRAHAQAAAGSAH